MQKTHPENEAHEDRDTAGTYFLLLLKQHKMSCTSQAESNWFIYSWI